MKIVQLVTMELEVIFEVKVVGYVELVVRLPRVRLVVLVQRLQHRYRHYFLGLRSLVQRIHLLDKNKLNSTFNHTQRGSLNSKFEDYQWQFFLGRKVVADLGLGVFLRCTVVPKNGHLISLRETRTAVDQSPEPDPVVADVLVHLDYDVEPLARVTHQRFGWSIVVTWEFVVKEIWCLCQNLPSTGSTSFPSELTIHMVWLSMDISSGQFRNSAFIRRMRCLDPCNTFFFFFIRVRATL